MERAMSLGEKSGVRETLRAQQELLQKLRQELDEEREASATATSEALSMIVRLQGEKAALGMEASQYKRMAEEKMCHAETSLSLFEDLIFHKEMEIASLEFQLQSYRYRLLSLGFSDPSLLPNKFPDSLFFFPNKRIITRALSSPLDAMNNHVTPLLVDKEAMDDISIDNLDERKTPENSVSPRGDLSTYWEQIKRIDEHVREISDSRDPLKENKFSSLRRESMSRVLVSQLSNTILETAKSDVSYIMEKMKNADSLAARDASTESHIPSSNVQDIFEVPRTKDSLAVILEEGEHTDKTMEKHSDRCQKMKELERRRDMSFKTEHLSLLKEIREQLSVMQSEMRSLRSELRPPVSPPQEDRTLQSLNEAMIHFWI